MSGGNVDLSSGASQVGGKENLSQSVTPIGTLPPKPLTPIVTPLSSDDGPTSLRREDKPKKKFKFFGKKDKNQSPPVIPESLDNKFDIVRTRLTDTTAPPQFAALTVMTTDGVKRYPPGFTPNQAYWGTIIKKDGQYVISDLNTDEDYFFNGDKNSFNNNDSKLGVNSNGLYPNGWWGNLLDAHISKISGVNDSPESQNRIGAYDKLGTRTSNPDTAKKPKSGEDPFSKRDTLMMFNDLATDYFQHNTLIEGNAVFFNQDETDEAVANTKLRNFSSSSWENQDPVVYSFQVVIDALSSPLLNGSVEEFIDAYPNVSEIQSRRRVIYDFKMQFQKLFKTKGKIECRQKEIDLYDKEALYSDYGSSYLNKYANADNPLGSTLKRRGKRAYLAHYLYKIDGLHKLSESNTSDTKKFLVDYGKDIITLTFNEDVSGTMAALAHLYKMLYWSKPLGKGVIPENLLRFNCDIIVTEVRNFNRIRNAMAVSDKDVSRNIYKIQTIKDNVSRHIYSLKECQFYFDKMPHDDNIDNSQIKVYEGFDVKFDYKYSSLKFDKWVSDPNLFGRYVGYNNGALWRLGNKMSYQLRKMERAEGGDTGSIIDYSVPRFYTKKSNSLGQDGVNEEIELMNNIHNNSVDYDEPFDDPNDFAGYKDAIIVEEDGEDVVASRKGKITVFNKETGKFEYRSKPDFEQRFKQKAKQGIKRMVKNTLLWPWREAKMQFMVRKELLQDTLSRARLFVGGGGLDTEPTNVYPRPYAPVSMGIFFDVRNELFNYWGEELTGILANAKQIINPFGHQVIDDLMPNGLKKSDSPSIWFNPLNMMLKKFSNLPSVLQESIKAKDFQNIINAMKTISSTLGGGFFQNSLFESSDNLKDILNKNAYFKPKNEGDGTPGSYKAYDYNDGFGGPGDGDQNIKAESSLNNILNKNANLKPKNEGDGSVGSYKAYDYNDKKYSSTNVGFGGQGQQSVKAESSVENILNEKANFKPIDEGVDKGKKVGKYKPYDYQEPKAGNNYAGTPIGFGFSALGKQSVPSDKTTTDTLNKNAKFKPKNEGDGSVGSYKAYDYNDKKYSSTNVGFGGQGQQSVKAESSIENILNKKANFKPIDEGVDKGKKVGKYKPYDYQEPKAGSNYGGAAPVGFGFSALGKQSVPSDKTTTDTLNKNSKFKPKNEGDGTAGSYKSFDVNKGFGGQGAQGVKLQGNLEKILNSFAQFRPADEGVSNGKQAGQYIPKDPNVGFGGAAVPQSSDNTKSQGKLEDIVKNNTQWSYPVNNKKFGL